MTISTTRFAQLKSNADRLKLKSAEAVGELKGLLKQLDTDFNCSSIEDAEELLEQLNESANQAEEEFNEAMQEFENKWGEILDNLDR